MLDREDWVPRPTKDDLQVLLAALRETGIAIKGTSFDAISLSISTTVDFADLEAVRAALPFMTFIEIKTAGQARVGHDFSGFFFALTESEIAAAEALGERHKVALYNKRTDNLMMTSVPEILARAKSTTWQVSVQI